MERLLRAFLRQFIRRGTLRLTTAGGTTFTVGNGNGPAAAVRFTSKAAELGVLLDPEVKLGEAYTNGSFVVEQGSIGDVLAILLGQNNTGLPPNWAHLQWLMRYAKRRLQQFNRPCRAQRNIAHHYDLDGRLYGLFLDSDRQYSCAYFETLDQSLDDAQLAKKRHLAAKLLIGNNARVLDIGSGWGGLALYLADHCDACVTGITLSQEQLASARAHASEHGLSDRVEFRLQDYRDLKEKFDRIVSVGMFEHVGVVFTMPISAVAATCSPMTGCFCCTRSAARRGRMSPIPGSPNTYSRAAIFRLYPRCCRRSSAQGCSSPTLKSYACIMPRR
jgi:cyclopropane-fatty-acyl-phospholipid synthase